MRQFSLAVLLALTACKPAPPAARAFQIQSREELIGGRRALGEVGDYKISNGLIHAIVQNVGTSRGFGAFGGSLIDVDLVRAAKVSGATGVEGNDHFTEMFPAFFLQAVEPAKVEVANDGSDGNPAVLRVSGRGGDFVSIVKSLNGDLIPPLPMDYTVEYILEPGKQYLKIVVTVTNADPVREAGFPLAIPFGFVTLLGEGQGLFVPGMAGYDMRYHLADVYKRPSKLEALPGEVTSMVTSEGQGVSYAIAANPRGASYMALNPDFYPGLKPDSMLIPLASKSFLGTFWGKPPSVMKPKASYSYSGYLAVGGGDVASAQRIIYDIDEPMGRKALKTGTLSGRVTEAGTQQRLSGISVVLQNEAGEYVSQARTREGGLYTAPVPKGRYRAFAVDSVRSVAKSDYVDVTEDGHAQVWLQMEEPAALSVTVRDERGRQLPAKISVEGTYEHSGVEPPRDFLYDLKVNERFRPSDFLPDEAAKPETRRYLETSFFTAHGNAQRAIRPGTYRVYASRGPEYELASAEVTLNAGQTTEVQLKVKQAFDTPDWVSGDFHVHSVNSIDSDMSLRERVTSYAAEGVDYMVSTDHNYVTDLAPTLEAEGLSDWLKSSVGLELTSLEMGHFNAYPVKLDPGAVTHGAFRWFRRPPGELFAQLRGMGSDPTRTVVQVNHPRDTVLGYFNAFNIGVYTGAPLPNDSVFKLDIDPLPDGSVSPYHPSQFSLDFDALEIFNGKRSDLLHSYRIPLVEPEGEAPKLPNCPLNAPQTENCIPAPGEILQDVVKVPDGMGGEKTVLNPHNPGGMDDWFTLLSQGHRMTGMGNSDSHGPSGEAGLPRTYLRIGASANGSMRGMSEAGAIDAIHSGKAVVTNGPFVEAWVNGEPIGSDVVAPDGSIDVRVRVQAAGWVDVKRVLLLRGGVDAPQPVLLDTWQVGESTQAVRIDETKRYTGIPDNSYLVVEVYGDKSMWPVFTPDEVESIQITDAVGALAGSFGFGSKTGKYRPVLLHTITPYAFTNPIRITRSLKQALKVSKPVSLMNHDDKFVPRTLNDLRRLYGAFHSDPQ